VRAEWSRPSFASTLRMVIKLCWEEGVSSEGSGSLSVSAVNVLICYLPKSAVIVSQRPPFDCSSSVIMSPSALLCRSCSRHGIEGQFLAMWP
jgi:hypothetical protein